MIHTPSVLVVQVRQSLSDFAVLIAILITVGMDVAIGIPTPKLEVPEQFKVGLSGVSVLTQAQATSRKTVLKGLHTNPSTLLLILIKTRSLFSLCVHALV